MNGAIAVAEANATSAAISNNITTSGIIHHSFWDQRKAINSPAIPKRDPRSRIWSTSRDSTGSVACDETTLQVATIGLA